LELHAVELGAVVDVVAAHRAPVPIAVLEVVGLLEGVALVHPDLIGELSEFGEDRVGLLLADGLGPAPRSQPRS